MLFRSKEEFAKHIKQSFPFQSAKANLIEPKRHIDELPEVEIPERPEIQTDEISPSADCPFRILGCDGDKFYYLPLSNRRIISLTASQHKKLELLQLAPAWYWENQFPGKGSEGVDWFAVANALIQQTSSRDFDYSMIRGRGAWLDAGTPV